MYHINSEVKECFDALNENPDCRVIVLSGSGRLFTAGLDLKDAIKTAQAMSDIDEPARKGHFMEKRLRQYQVFITSTPIIAKKMSEN